MVISTSIEAPEHGNPAAANLGGPIRGFGLLDAPTPSAGMPSQFASNLPFKFSSSNTDTA